jgi:hypothetical protein
MKISYRLVVMMALILTIFQSGCQDQSAESASSIDEIIIDGSPVPPYEEASEFELMALCVSGELTPPAELVSMFQEDINAIRALVFPTDEVNTTPATDITFRPPWGPGKVSIGFDDDIKSILESGNYHAWDELNSRYFVSAIDINTEYGVYARLELGDKAINPERIAEEYELLPGVAYATASHLIGDGDNIYPYIPGYKEGIIYAEGIDENIRYYLFKKGDGDCPSGCTIKDYWMFSADKNGVDYIGEYHINEEEVPVEPSWWAIAQSAMRFISGTY